MTTAETTNPSTAQNALQNTKIEDIIFSALFKDDEGVHRRKQEILTTFGAVSVFENEYHVFFTLLKEFPKLSVNKDLLQLFMTTNRANFQKSESIILMNYSNGETDEYVEFVNATLETFDMLCKTVIQDADYYRTVAMHKMEYINKQSIEILEESTYILSEGVKRRGKVLSGYDDMRKNVKHGFLELDNMMNKDDRKGIVTYDSDSMDEDEANATVKLVTTYGIKELDDAMGGIYEGDMVSLLAPAKGCKTRFATYILHNAMVNHGQNIGMWSVENGYKGWEALIRARHFNWFYNSQLTGVEGKRHITADMIRKGELSPELKELERASWADLRFNPAYGRIFSVDQDFDLDTITEVLEQLINDYGVKFLCVDYLQLITGGNQRFSKNERIGEAYKEVLQLLKKKRVAGIFPAQLKQSVVGDIQRVDPSELINMELRDSAGESYEVIKTPDVNIALYGTVEDIRNGSMKLLSIPSRNSSPFEPVDLFVDAGSCTFGSIPKRTA